jgi:hypothetical protein
MKTAKQINNQPQLDQPDSKGWWWCMGTEEIPMCFFIGNPKYYTKPGDKWIRAIVPEFKEASNERT